MVNRTLPLLLTAATAALISLTAVAATQKPAPQSPPAAAAVQKSPEQVAEMIDSVIQPRFQKSAGQFGAERVVSSLDGHPTIDDMYNETPRERAVFRTVRQAGRSYVIGILHCAHKPGHHVDVPRKNDSVDPTTDPTYQALISVHATDKKAIKTYEWADNHLTKVIAPYAKALRRGKPQQTTYGNWIVVMKPILASHNACLSCHAGAKRGDTLGVMVYSVNQKVTRDKLTKVWDGGGA